MKTAFAFLAAATLMVGCTTAPSTSGYGSVGGYRTGSVNSFPEPDRPAQNGTAVDQAPPVLDPPYRPMSVSGPPPASRMAGELVRGLARTLTIVGMTALSGRSFSIGGGRVYGNVYLY